MFRNLLIVILLTTSISQAQIGVWKDYLSYSSTIAITSGNSKIYAISKSGVFYYNTKYGNLVKQSKITGLSDVEPTAIKYHKASNTLLIGYQNGNLDLLINETVINISDIKDKTGLGSKVINEIFFKDNLAYLSCGFGVVVLNLKKQEIKETYFIGNNGTSENINELTITPKYIYAATDIGVKRALFNNTNLGNFNNWENMNLPIGKYNTIASLGNKVYTNLHSVTFSQDSMYYYNDTIWTLFRANYAEDVNDINVIDNKIYTAVEFNVQVYDSNHVNIKNIYTYGEQNLVGPQTSEVIQDEQGDVWIADKRLGIVWATNFFSSRSYFPSGPPNSNVYELEFIDNMLYVATGVVNNNFDNTWNRDGVYKLSNNSWQKFNYQSIKQFDFNIYFDVLDVSTDPVNTNKFYMSTWGKGLIEFTDTNFVIYDTTNSILQGFNKSNNVKVGGTSYDESGNLWITNAASNKVIAVKTKNNVWYSYNIPELNNTETIGDIIIDDNNYKWVILGKTPGVLVFSDNNTLDNTFDDRYELLHFPNGVKVLSVIQDLDGAIWFGTEEGIFVNHSPHNIFNNPKQPAERIVVSNGTFAGNLLESEKVLSIAVDGANRKWIGTENAGVFLVSANGKEQLAHFTETNSPLLANNVLDIAINKATGEVFFGTLKGIVSYMGEATEVKDEFTEVIIYPNPVPTNYTGKIGIKGLVEDSNIKVTDLQGNLVFEANATGGQFVWNGLSFDGNKVVTGVYLVFITNPTGEQTHKTKILIK